jgi:DNA-binding CsgD family transcriptional regulator
MSPITELMARSVDGVFAIGDEQRVIFWNEACESMTGIPASDAVGSRCHEILKGHDPHGRTLCRPDCPLSSLSKGGPPPSQLPMRICHANGEALQLCVSTMLVPSARDDQWNVVHVMRRGRRVKEEDAYLNAGMEDRVVAQYASQARRDSCHAAASMLTTRERQILQLLAHGAAVNSMSDNLHISVATVRNHIQRLMAKLEVHSRVEAVAYAHRNQLI